MLLFYLFDNSFVNTFIGNFDENEFIYFQF